MNVATTGVPYAIQDTDTILYDGSPRYVLRVRDLEVTEKPREKLLAGGPGSLSLAELVAVIWNVGSRKEDVLQMAGRVIHEYGTRAIGNETNPVRLSEALDIPLNKACQLIACLEIGRRQYATRSGRAVCIRTAQQAYVYIAPMADSAKEQLRGLYLNSRYELIHDEVISVGSLTANIVHPREVFQPAIAHAAAAIIIAHNHPSGTLTPTQADLDITAQLRAAGAVLGIELLDHLIVTQQNYYSILEDHRAP